MRELIEHTNGAEPLRLPTEAELTQRFRVSRQTARQAYGELVDEGLVERAPGKGSFASRSRRYLLSVSSVEDLLAPPAVDRDLEVVAPLTFVTDIAAATKLGLPTDDVATVAYRLVRNNRPYALIRSFLPPDVAQVLLADVAFLHEQGGVGKETVLSILDRRLRQGVVFAKQRFAAMAAPADVAESIGCRPNDPVLNIECIYFDTDARPVQLTVTYGHPELYEYRVQLQRRPVLTENNWRLKGR